MVSALRRLRNALPSVRVPGVLLAAGAMLLAGAACGTAVEEPSDSVREKAHDQPVTVKHQYGTTKVSQVPQRVVTVDPQWTDVMLAMGAEPVGYSVDPLMPRSGVPWQELPAEATALQLTAGVPVEQIAQLKPDLILGTYSIADRDTYALLSDIAPTIAAEDPMRVTPWQDLVRTAGDLLAEPERAERVIESVDRELAGAARELPGLEGKTFAFAQYIVGDAMYIVADPADASSIFFQQLGMRMYPPILEQGQKTGQTRLSVSTERSDLLRADLLTFLVNGGDQSDLADIPGFGRLPGTVAVLDYATIVGLNTPSPLSIPYALKAMRPHLEEAAKSAASRTRAGAASVTPARAAARTKP